VREADPRVRGKLNLPGGHLDQGESLIGCAKRELREETGLHLDLSGLLDVYMQGTGIHFVFVAEAPVTDATPGGDILSCEWLSPEESLALPEVDILRPKKLRAIVTDFLADRTTPST